MPDLKLSPTHRYPEVGCCIYCGTTDLPLSDEHVIPFALGGHLLLPKASCQRCSNETHAFEGKTVGATLRNIRLRHGFPTRRKKQRETHIEIGTVDERGRLGRRKVPVTEYPVGAFIPHFGRAGFAIGAPPFLDVMRDTAQCYPTDDLNEFKLKYRWDGMIMLRHLPIEFARTIVKICYAYAIGEIGMGSFHPLCAPYIISKERNISYVFGQIGINKKVKGDSPVWEILLGLQTNGKELFLIAHCSILPGMGTPVYEVLLGNFQSQEQISSLHEKLSDKRLVISPLPLT